MEIFFLIGRVMLGGYLLLNAYNHLFKPSGLASYAESKKVPAPKVSVIVSGLLLLFGAYTILTGVRTEAGIWALILFFVPVTFTMHSFWKIDAEVSRSNAKIEFLKNLAIVGALLMLLAIPTPWPYSVG